MSLPTLNPSRKTSRELLAPGGEELENLRHLDRSPHPYHRNALGIQQDSHVYGDEPVTGSGAVVSQQGRDERQSENEQWQRSSRQSSVTGSESGTEADDERPRFVKALPPPILRPRKGLKGGEKGEDGDLTPLLTPSQLDDDGRHLSQEYFDSKNSEQEVKASYEKVKRRRLAEFFRRISEVALVGGMAVCVLCANAAWPIAWTQGPPILSFLLAITTLIISYPLKLSFLETSTTFSKPWQRFRVPASFDPATVLYPTFLPVLVALALGSDNANTVLPNLILGLASLPQRLFPRSSRLDGINTFHWLVSTLPLLVAQHTPWLSKTLFHHGTTLSRPSASAEILATLYPLHHTLLQSLHYLTTTSLLISELHLLSAGLINLLLHAVTPQSVILKSCVWIGGVTLFMLSYRTLNWNVTLARVPKWKLRRPGHPREERRSLVQSVKQLINVRRSALAFRAGVDESESDADEDEPTTSIKTQGSKSPQLLTSGPDFPALTPSKTMEPRSAIERSSTFANGSFAYSTNGLTRPRRNTLSEGQSPNLPQGRSSSKRKGRSSNLLWCLRLTPSQAQRRKWLYAACVYAAMALVILGPVRNYVSKHALYGKEPIGWALSYLLAEIPIFASTIEAIGLKRWVPLTCLSCHKQQVSLALPLSVDGMRWAVGPANARLLLSAYWALVILIGLLAVFSLTAYVEVDTRRKVFHGVMVAMLLPATFVDPCYCALALAIVLTVFLLLEVVRGGQVPPLGNAIGRFVAPYVDGRDLRGPVVVSHIFLLIGCAIPMWLSLAGIARMPAQPDVTWTHWELEGNKRDVGMIAGVVCVGMGDAAASLIGRRYGRRKWMWIGGKSLEGSAAFVAAVTVGLMAAKAWLWIGGWSDASLEDEQIANGVGASVLYWLTSLAKAVFCACGTSFMEAVLTGANDNVVVPIALWLFVKGTRL